MTIGLPADAEVVSSGSGGCGEAVLVTTDNSTVCVTTNYRLEFTTKYDLTVSDKVYLDFRSSSFEFSLDDLTNMTLNGLSSTVTVNEQGVFEIVLPVTVFDGINVTIELPDIQNPSFPGCYTFADVWTSKDPGIIQFAVKVTPRLMITPSKSNCFVGSLVKLTIELVDGQGNPFNVPDEFEFIPIELEEFVEPVEEPKYGNFYDLDLYRLEDNCISIESGNASSAVYYQPKCEGNKKVFATHAVTPFGEIKEVYCEINVIDEPVYWTIKISSGWNIVSAPFNLEQTTLDEVIENPEYIEIALTYDEGQWKQISVTESQLKPLHAIYVKLRADKESNAKYYYPSEDSSYTRDLDAGWNLVGPVVYNIDSDGKVNLEQALYSIEGKYSQVTCPSPDPDDANKLSWTYIPGAVGGTPPDMQIGHGYWVYMEEAGELFVDELK